MQFEPNLLYFNSSKVRLEQSTNHANNAAWNISIPVRYDWNLWAQMWIVFVYHLVAVAKIRQESGKKCRCRKIDFGRGYDNCISEGYNVIKELKF